MEEAGTGFTFVTWRVVPGCAVEMYCVTVPNKFKLSSFLIITTNNGWQYKEPHNSRT